MRANLTIAVWQCPAGAAVPTNGRATMRCWLPPLNLTGVAAPESGFVRVAANPKVLPSPIGVERRMRRLSALRAGNGHRFLVDDVLVGDADVSQMSGNRQVTVAHLVALARRQSVRLVTFDAAVLALADDRGVQLLTAL